MTILIIICVIMAIISYSCCVSAARADREMQKMIERAERMRKLP